jgi:uncharacterized membrane protein (UPF0127 family)
MIGEPPALFTLVNQERGTIVAAHLLTAFESKARNKGLLGRDSLSEDSALIIAPSNAVHTFFMRFSIDIAFVAKDGRVLKVRAAVPPWRFAGAMRGFAVVELPAGALRRSQTVDGDALAVRVDERRREQPIDR